MYDSAESLLESPCLPGGGTAIGSASGSATRLSELQLLQFGGPRCPWRWLRRGWACWLWAMRLAGLAAITAWPEPGPATVSAAWAW